MRPMQKLKFLYHSYLQFFIRYFSFKKMANALLNTYEFKTKKTKLKSFPWVAGIDPANICVLSCPLCPTGQKKEGVTPKIITFEEFKKYFDQIKNYLFFIRLYDWGEPFLCKDIWKIVEYCHKNNVGVIINSNFNAVKEKDIKKMIKYKIDYLMLSIDGVTQEIYEKYRCGGNLKKVFQLLSDLIKLKKEKKVKYPFIHWQYLLSKKNKCECEKAQLKAKKMGVDLFEVHNLRLFTSADDKPDMDIFKEWVLGDFSQQQGGKTCHILWTSANITPTGLFAPCHGIYNEKYSFGDLKKESLKEIWNNELFQEARERFVEKDFKARTDLICHKCIWYK